VEKGCRPITKSENVLSFSWGECLCVQHNVFSACAGVRKCTTRTAIDSSSAFAFARAHTLSHLTLDSSPKNFTQHTEIHRVRSACCKEHEGVRETWQRCVRLGFDEAHPCGWQEKDSIYGLCAGMSTDFFSKRRKKYSPIDMPQAECAVSLPTSHISEHSNRGCGFGTGRLCGLSWGRGGPIRATRACRGHN
jgi:hypothetical protein